MLVSRVEYALRLEIGYISQLAIKRDKRFGAAEVDDDEGGIYKKTTAQSSGERAGGDS